MFRKNFIKAAMLLICSMMIFAGCKKDDKNEEPSGNGGGNGGGTVTAVTDADGNVYETVTIGTQTWMTENLKTTKYNNGTAIPNVTDGNAWATLSTPAYCWYNNDPTKGYGVLYNWYAVEIGNLCPTGWHVPSDDEWTALTDYLHTQGYTGGDSGNDATPLKSTTGWAENGNGTDAYGFSAFQGGYCVGYDVSFYEIGDYGFWWSSTEYNGNNAYSRTMYYYGEDVYKDYNYKGLGLSVRCLRD